MRLRKAGYCAGGLQLSVRGRESRWSDDITFAATQDTLEFLRALDLLWRRRAMADAPSKVAVVLFHLDLQQGCTPMFAALRRDHSALCAAVDKVNLGFGGNKVYFGGAHRALHHAPMRIAFTRIPDPETEG